MKNPPLPFPGEDEFAGRLLRTASYLIDRGRLLAACDVLELVDPHSLGDEQLDELEALATRGKKLAAAQRLPLLAAPMGRLLAFRAPLSTLPKRSSA